MIAWALLAIVILCWLLDRHQLKNAVYLEKEKRELVEEQLADQQDLLNRTESLMKDMEDMNIEVEDDIDRERRSD